MVGIEGKRFRLNKENGCITFYLRFPVFTIKVRKALIDIGVLNLGSDKLQDVTNMSLDVTSRNLKTGKKITSSISLFSPSLVASTTALVNINKVYPSENIGLSNRSELLYDILEISLNYPEGLPDYIEVSIEFDSRPGGFDHFEKYQTEFARSKKTRA